MGGRRGVHRHGRADAAESDIDGANVSAVVEGWVIGRLREEQEMQGGVS